MAKVSNVSVNACSVPEWGGGAVPVVYRNVLSACFVYFLLKRFSFVNLSCVFGLVCGSFAVTSVKICLPPPPQPPRPPAQ